MDLEWIQVGMFLASEGLVAMSVGEACHAGDFGNPQFITGRLSLLKSGSQQVTEFPSWRSYWGFWRSVP